MEYIWSMYGVSSDLEGNYYGLTRKAKTPCSYQKQQEKGMKNRTRPKNLLGSVGKSHSEINFLYQFLFLTRTGLQ